MGKTGFKKAKGARKAFLIFNTLFMVFLCAAVIVPILKILSSALGNKGTYGLELLPRRIDLIPFERVLGMYRTKRAFLVSLGTTAAVTLIGLIISSISAYILMQRDMPGAKLFGYMLLVTLVFNVGFIPEYLAMKKLGLQYSYLPIVLPLCLNAANIFLLRNYFEQLPQSIMDAAEIDGCTPVDKFFMIVLPLSRAPLAVIGLFFASAAWNEYFRYILYSTSNTENLQYVIRDWTFPGCLGVSAPDWLRGLNYQSFICANVILGVLAAVVFVTFFMHFFKPPKDVELLEK